MEEEYILNTIESIKEKGGKILTLTITVLMKKDLSPKTIEISKEHFDKIQGSAVALETYQKKKTHKQSEESDQNDHTEKKKKKKETEGEHANNTTERARRKSSRLADKRTKPNTNAVTSDGSDTEGMNAHTINSFLH